MIHDHHFNQHLAKAGEARTRWVVFLTVVTMVVEIGPGYRAAIVTVESDPPAGPDQVRNAIPADLGIAHLTVETRRPCNDGATLPAPEENE